VPDSKPTKSVKTMNKKVIVPGIIVIIVIIIIALLVMGGGNISIPFVGDLNLSSITNTTASGTETDTNSANLNTIANYCIGLNKLTSNGKVGILADSNNNTSVISKNGEKAEFILIYENKLFTKAVPTGVNASVASVDLVKVLKDNGLSTIILDTPDLNLAEKLKSNTIKCYKSTGKINTFANENTVPDTSPSVPPGIPLTPPITDNLDDNLLTTENNLISTGYCTEASATFKLSDLNGKVAIASETKNGSTISSATEQAPYFVFYEGIIKKGFYKNDFLDAIPIQDPTTMATNLIAELKQQGTTSVILAATTPIFDGVLRTNEITCLIKTGSVSGIRN